MAKRLDDLRDWEKRLVTEHWELDEKIQKLAHALKEHTGFFTSSERSRLRVQLKAMEEYHAALEERCLALGLL